MIKHTAGYCGRYKNDTVGNGPLSAVNRIIQYNKGIRTLLASGISGRTTLVKSNCGNAAGFDHQLCCMVQTKSIVSVGSINLNCHYVALGSKTNASTRINLLSLVGRCRIIFELVYTIPNDYLITLAGFGNSILIIQPLTCFFNDCCSVI